MNLLNIASVLCIGFLVGAELSVSVFTNPVLWKLDSAAQAQAIRLFAHRLGKAMPVWYIASLLLLLSETIMHRHESVVVQFGISTAIWVAVIALTLVFLVPINNRMAGIDADRFSESDRREHRKWDALHRARVFALALAMVFLLVGVGL